jgi:inner membrane protease subunit 2
MLRNIFTKVIFGGAIGVTFIDLCGYCARVEGESMKPCLNPINDETDYVFLNKYKARDYKVEHGEVICLISPKDAQQRIIKRVIGKEGDVVMTHGYKDKFVKVPVGHIFIEGDNINNSLDSNTFGTIPIGLMTAKATHIIWPPSRWKRIRSENVRQPIKFGGKIKNETLRS